MRGHNWRVAVLTAVAIVSIALIAVIVGGALVGVMLAVASAAYDLVQAAL